MATAESQKGNLHIINTLISASVFDFVHKLYVNWFCFLAGVCNEYINHSVEYLNCYSTELQVRIDTNERHRHFAQAVYGSGRFQRVYSLHISEPVPLGRAHGLTHLAGSFCRTEKFREDLVQRCVMVLNGLRFPFCVVQHFNMAWHGYIGLLLFTGWFRDTNASNLDVNLTFLI